MIIEIYGTNQVVLDSTRHTMTYEPSTARLRLQMRHRRALELIERGRRHRSSENRPDFTPCKAQIRTAAARLSGGGALSKTWPVFTQKQPQ